MKGLTTARRNFLATLIAEGGTGRGADYYPPIKWLAEKGLIVKRVGKYSDYWAVTQAGREALTSQENHHD